MPFLGRRASLTAITHKDHVSEWGVCWVRPAGPHTLHVQWLEGGLPKHEYIKRTKVLGIQYLSEPAR